MFGFVCENFIRDVEVVYEDIIRELGNLIKESRVIYIVRDLKVKICGRKELVFLKSKYYIIVLNRKLFWIFFLFGKFL